MNLVELTEFIVKSLVKEKEEVSVKEFETDNEKEILIQVFINENDMGRVIGKQGKIANSIRTLVQASSSLKEDRRVRINIDHF